MNTNPNTPEEKIRSFIGDDVSHLITRIREVGEELAELESERDYLRDLRKVKLHEIIDEERAKLKADGVKITEKKVESLARQSSKYKMHLIKTRDKAREAAKKRQEYYEVRNLYDSAIEQMRNWRLKERKKRYERN